MPWQNRPKNSAIVAVISVFCQINLLLNNRRLLCCFYAKKPRNPVSPVRLSILEINNKYPAHKLAKKQLVVDLPLII
jgi:hypothetical protein